MYINRNIRREKLQVTIEQKKKTKTKENKKEETRHDRTLDRKGYTKGSKRPRRGRLPHNDGG